MVFGSQESRCLHLPLSTFYLLSPRLCFFIVLIHDLLAHLSRRLIVELIVYTCSGVRRCCCCHCHSPFSNIFSSVTAWPIKAKLYVEPLWERGTKVCVNGLGYMTKMAAMPIYGKNLDKSSPPEPIARFQRNLVCSIGDSSPS